MYRPGTNQLIRALPRTAQRALMADFVRMEITALDILSPAQLTAQVFFPIGAVVSVVCASQGATVDVRGIGSESMIGSQGLHVTEYPRFDLVCQIGGEMLAMRGPAFAAHLLNIADIGVMVSRYSMTVFALVAQSVVCNGLHSIAQRSARWLLTTSDRVGSAEFSLTHDGLARMLGATVRAFR